MKTIPLVFAVLLPVVGTADEPAVRFLTTGWNTPTAQQFVRDGDTFRSLPFDGCVINIRDDAGSSNPFSKAHAAGSWHDLSFSAAEASLDALSFEQAQASYLVINADPGDADWLDDAAWSDVVQHWRIAARLAKRGKLRGLVFDPEPYSKPFEQFNYTTQSGAAEHSFAQYIAAARRRGHDVMAAVADEFPELEIVSYFLMSYLVNDHRYRGPSPIDKDDIRREDFEWCLAGHAYGLLAPFLSGLLDAAPERVRLVDGCEYGYWLSDPQEFAKLARDVRVRGRMLVDADVRSKYDRQVSVAFPVFVDIVHPTLIPEWALEPEGEDPLAVLRRQLTAAAEAGDGLVWFYGERGTWWPDPTETALWKGKDVYPNWSKLLPGCIDVIGQVRQAARPKSLTWTGPGEAAAVVVGQSVSFDAWQTWVPPEMPGQATTDDDIVTIRGATDGAALCRFAATPGERFRVTARVRQTGRGVTKLVVCFRDGNENWVDRRGVNALAFPEPGDPTQWRNLTTDALVPDGAVEVIVILGAALQPTPQDAATFERLAVNRLDL